MFGNPETTTGGNALKFYSSVRLDIRSHRCMKGKAYEVVGSETGSKWSKNKVAPPFRPRLKIPRSFTARVSTTMPRSLTWACRSAD